MRSPSLADPKAVYLIGIQVVRVCAADPQPEKHVCGWCRQGEVHDVGFQVRADRLFPQGIGGNKRRPCFRVVQA